MNQQPNNPRPVHGLHWLMHAIHFAITMIVICALHMTYVEWMRQRPHKVTWLADGMVGGDFSYSNRVVTTNHQVEVGLLDDGSMVWRMHK